MWAGRNRTDGPYTVGNRFTVGGSPITINALGLQDLGAAGIAANTPIGIWTDANVLLRTANVLSGSANNTLSSGYQYVFIAPLTLTSGTTYRIAAVVGGAFESFQDANLSAVYAGNGGSIVADVYNAGGTLTFPNSDGGGNDARWAPANAALLIAGTRTWNGGSGSDNNFTSNANWGGSDLKAGDNLVFAGSTRTSPNNNILANTGFSSITFNAGAASFTVGGNAVNLLGDVTNNSTNLQTINTPLVLDGATRTFNTAAGNMTVGAVISSANGANGLTKTGAGILTLNAVNTYTGLTTVSQGTLTLGVGGAISIASPLNVTIASGATLNLSGAANNQLSSTNNTGTWTINGTLANTTNNAHSIYASAINMTGGTMTSSGGNGGQAATYGAFYSFNNTTITANGTGNVISGNGDFGIAGGTTLFLATPLAGDTLNVSTILKNVTSAASLTKLGLGTVTLSGANTYTGDTFINAGTLQYNAGGSSNNSPFIRIGLNSGSANATLALSSGVTLSSGWVSRDTGTGVRTISSLATSGTATLSGLGFMDRPLTTASAAGGTLAFTGASIDLKGNTLTVSGPGNTTISSILKNDVGSGSLAKNDGGTLTLTGANTYSGGTTISAGTLKISNATGSATGSGNVNVGANGTLSGTGNIVGGAVNLAGTVSPGNSVGTLFTDNFNWQGGGTYDWEVTNLSGTPGTGWDLLDLSGSLLTFVGGGPFIVDIDATAIAFDYQNHVFEIVRAGGAGDVLGFSADDFTLNATGPAAFQWSIYEQNNSIFLQAVATPEPSTLVLFAVSGMLITCSGVFLQARRKNGLTK